MKSALLFLVATLALSVPAVSRAGAAKDANPGFLKMALVNMKSVYSDGPDVAANRAGVRANLDRHLYFIDKVAAEGAEFVGFPELSLNGYRFGDGLVWLSLEGSEVSALKARAIARGVYVAAGMAEQDADGKRWNTHFVIDPAGKVIGRHRKIYLTKEAGVVGAGTEHNVFVVKGLKVGIAICADGSDRKNLQALADNGAQLIYGPHANTTGGTTAGWYKVGPSEESANFLVPFAGH